VKIFGFAIFGPYTFCGLRICDVRTQLFFEDLKLPQIRICLTLHGKYQFGSGSETRFVLCKFAHLRFANWDSKEICKFAICELNITNLRFAIFGVAHLKNCGFAIAEGENEFENLRFADYNK
jgi:hypothetical protein